MEIKRVLKSQYHAALATLREAIEQCDDELWLAGVPAPTWQVAYHAVFYTHLYLQPRDEDFRPWEHHREQAQFLEELPWPPHDKPDPGEPYTRRQVLDYWREVDEMIDLGVERLDLQAEDCGFWWYKLTKLEHQFMNVRHVEHHTGQIAQRLRDAGHDGVSWIGGGRA
ncbi:MAG: DinB family protein [Phycisphaerae bacterium]